jgi:hypothetical protein
MTRWLKLVSLGVVAGVAAQAGADDRQKRAFRTELVSYNEVPAVSSPARGSFRAFVDEQGTSLTFWLTYEDLTFDASMAHIHFGQHHTNGGISVWLCQSNVNPAPSSVAGRVATCPLRATSAPISAANVHSGIGGATPVGFPGGEIRGQIN